MHSVCLGRVCVCVCVCVCGGALQGLLDPIKKSHTYCIAQGTLLNVMWQPGWEGRLGENGHMYM